MAQAPDQASGVCVSVEYAQARDVERQHPCHHLIEKKDRFLEVAGFLGPERQVESCAEVFLACPDGNHDAWSSGRFDLVEHFEIVFDALSVPSVVIPGKHYIVEGSILDVGHLLLASFFDDLRER